MIQNLATDSQKHQSDSSFKTIPEWLEDGANTYGKAIAISSTDKRPSLSYQALFEQTQTIATQLNSLGLKPGDIVAIALDNGSDFLTSILSVASVATALTLNPHQPEAEFDRYFSRLDVKAVIVKSGSNSAICTVANSANIPILELDSDGHSAGKFSLSSRLSRKSSDVCLQAKPKFSDHAILVGTSGSTGQPKIISLTHESFFVSINHAADWMQLTKSDRSLVLTPLAMLHALVRSSCPLLLRGGEVVCTPGYNPAKILDWLDEYRPSFFTGVPSMYRSLLQSIEETNWLPEKRSLRFLVTGSDKIDAAEIESIEQTLKVPLVQFYGMSEVSPLPVVRPFPPIVTPAGAVGKVNPMWQVACVDEKGDRLLIGKEGEIVLRGGYINQLVGITKAKKIEGSDDSWFHTGDLGYLDDAGFLYYTGRVDNRINRGGKKIYAKEIEAVLLTHPEIKAGVVFGIPDTLYGECIGAVVVLHSNAKVTPASIRQFIVERIADFKVPDRILIKDALPLNPFGKVKRKTLASHYGLQNLSSQRSLESPTKTIHVEPLTDIEKRLATIWVEILELSQVGIDESFWDLGGHSMLTLKLLARIETEFGRVLPANTLFDAPTIAQLAQFLDTSGDSQPWDCLVELRPGGNKPAFFLIHDADGDILLYLNLARNLKSERPVYGLRPYGKEGFPILDWSIEQIVNRYIDRILTVQPQGPYYLGGLCDGGIYAYEVGQQLQARGHQVGFIALLDAIDYEAVRRKHAEDVRKVIDRSKHELYRDLLVRGASLPADLKNQISVRMMLRLAKEGYTPQNFAGKLLLFRATARDFAASETPQYLKIADPLFGWQKRTEEIEIYDIPDTHSGILREPSVKLLANQLE